MTQIVPQSGNSWLSREELDSARERLPILYVDAIPVRVDETGTVVSVGLLLRVTGHGQMRFESHGDLGFPACAQAVQAARLPSARRPRGRASA